MVRRHFVTGAFESLKKKAPLGMIFVGTNVVHEVLTSLILHFVVNTFNDFFTLCTKTLYIPIFYEFQKFFVNYP
jgi:hypothetical protein